MFNAKYSNVINIAKSIKSLQVLINNEIKPRIEQLRSKFNKLQSLSLIFEQMIMRTETSTEKIVQSETGYTDMRGNTYTVNNTEYTATYDTLNTVNIKQSETISNIVVTPTIITYNYDYTQNVGYVVNGINKDAFNTTVVSAISNIVFESQILPFTIENVGAGAYFGIKTIENISVVPNPPLSCENVKYIGANAFNGIEVPNYVLNFQNISTIEFSAFENANVSCIEMYATPTVTLNTIPQNCFKNATIDTLMLPTTIDTISSSAFVNASINNLYVPLYCKYDPQTSFNGAVINNLWVIPGTKNNTPNNPLQLSASNNNVTIHNVSIADTLYPINKDDYISPLLVNTYIKTS